MRYCPDRCIGGSAGGHHPHCPSAPPEPDHDEGCDSDCSGTVVVPEVGDSPEFEFTCECDCHQEED